MVTLGNPKFTCFYTRFIYKKLVFIGFHLSLVKAWPTGNYFCLFPGICVCECRADSHSIPHTALRRLRVKSKRNRSSCQLSSQVGLFSHKFQCSLAFSNSMSIFFSRLPAGLTYNNFRPTTRQRSKNLPWTSLPAYLHCPLWVTFFFDGLSSFRSLFPKLYT